MSQGQLADDRFSRTRFVTPKLTFQYLLLSYAGLNVRGESRIVEEFQLGGYYIWADSEANWRKHLGVARPQEHLSAYVDRHGNPLGGMWVATPIDRRSVTPEQWQHLVAALFYLCWVRLGSHARFRVAADNFYFEDWSLPEGAPEDSAHHVRYSKYGATMWTKLTIFPGPDVSPNGAALAIPGARTVVGGHDLEATAVELFQKLDSELKKPESSMLTALWFFFNSCFRSASRSSYAEDIQNICTAFEAFLQIEKKGNSDEQVANKLTALFKETAPDPYEANAGNPAPEENPEVLELLRRWVLALYGVRNAYTHGRKVQSYLFNGRSIWVDAPEIFSLAVNRTLLSRPEPRPMSGTALSKLLMSGLYLQELIREFRRGKELFEAQRADATVRFRIRTLLDKAKVIDPERVEWIRSLSQFRQALYGLCSLIYYALKGLSVQDKGFPAELSQFLSAMEKACDQTYREAKKGGHPFDTRQYLNRVAPAFRRFENRALPVLGDEIFLYELTETFRMMYGLYREFEEAHSRPASANVTSEPKE